MLDAALRTDDLPAAGGTPTTLLLTMSWEDFLSEHGIGTYADGTPATVEQMSKDVSAFLVWTAEPFLEARHRLGWAVLVFLLFGTTLAYFAYKNIWADRKAKGGRETTSFSDPNKVGPLA